MTFLKLSEVNASQPLDYQSIIGLDAKLPAGVGGHVESMTIREAWLTALPQTCPICSNRARVGLIQLEADISIFHCFDGCQQFIWCEVSLDKEMN